MSEPDLVPSEGGGKSLRDVCDGVAGFLDSLHASRESRYRFAPNRPATQLSTSFVLTTLGLLGRDGSSRTNSALERIASEQSDDGHFIDPSFVPEHTRGSHSEDYIRWQFTFFALSALDIHGHSARSLRFMDPYLEPRVLARWLDERNWNRFWYSSNEIMFMLYFLSYLWRRQAVEAAHTAALHVLDELDARQDEKAGFWGNDKKLSKRMYGAAHLYMAYDFFDRPIRFPDRIIDSTLSLQLKNGLYGQRFGGACEDYDAVEILAKVSRTSQHRNDEVRRALAKTAGTIREHQTIRGGFAYRLVPRTFRGYHQLRLKLKGEHEYVYSGWHGMNAEVWRPDAWGTLFRCLALLVSDAALFGSATPARFYELPAWGYHPTGAEPAGASSQSLSEAT